MTGWRVIYWREAREHFIRNNRPTWSLLGNLLAATFITIFFPIYMALSPSPLSGAQISAFGSWAMVFLVAMGGQFAVLALAAEMFVGERERHTWETLLAAPIRLRDIIAGKVAHAMATSLLFASVAMLAGVTTILILLGPRALADLAVVPLGLVLTLGMSLFWSGAAVLVSGYATTIRGAQIALGLMTLPTFSLPVILVSFLFSSDPAGFFRFVVTVGPGWIVVWIAAVYGALGALLLGLGAKRMAGAPFRHGA